VREKTKLEEIVKVKLCRAIVDEVLRGVRSPERPSSPAELYVTEEQVFLGKNPEVISLKHLTLISSHQWSLCCCSILMSSATENDPMKLIF